MDNKKVFINSKCVDFDSMVVLMDDEIREELHSLLSPCTEQEFADAYLEAHFKKYNEQFDVS